MFMYQMFLRNIIGTYCVKYLSDCGKLLKYFHLANKIKAFQTTNIFEAKLAQNIDFERK